jgi:hypothetical protein
MAQSTGPEDLPRIRHTEYVEVISGGKVDFFECPHCAATFEAFGEVQLALIQCVAHARTCSKRPTGPTSPPKDNDNERRR